MFNISILNSNNEQIATGTDLLSYGFRCLYTETEQYLHFRTIDELLAFAKKEFLKPFYNLNGKNRVPINHFTHKHNDYFLWIGCWNLTVAEAILFGALNKARFTQNAYKSKAELTKLLETFGFSPASFKMHIHNLRKKIPSDNWCIENKNSVGYHLINIKHDKKMSFIIDNANQLSDYWILYNDKKLRHILPDGVHQTVSGAQYLFGQHGLTRTEAEIYFELVKHRGECVPYEQLLKLPWAVRYKKEECSLDKYLKNFIWKIRQKLANTELIENKHSNGYILSL